MIHETDNCQIYFKSDAYKNCDASCQSTSEQYHVCCEIYDYCSFYSTTWFFWCMVVIFIALIVGSVITCVLRYLRMQRGSGGGGDLEDVENSKTDETH
ncbi:hypothetical protein GCK72_007759 [Caenorhabditis remanei]|uniref:Uncharacterized protein n=1 Tax=Caenorhabditis remanei TaxID=31234 RepID=A0A6A5HI33_CAERE|nr:hypothetical protein GCK72_007759 [Caenorhabditis remanei]KAF1767800.1 hypothetical protein GCK72_007759 [Caenorhabditis remanei]